MTTYLVHICLEGRTPIAKILGILIASDILCMLFFRFVVYRNHTCKESHEIKRDVHNQFNWNCLRRLYYERI